MKVLVEVILPMNVEMCPAQENGLHKNSRYPRARARTNINKTPFKQHNSNVPDRVREKKEEKQKQKKREKKNSDNKLVVKSTCKHANASSHAMHAYVDIRRYIYAYGLKYFQT